MLATRLLSVQTHQAEEAITRVFERGSAKPSSEMRTRLRRLLKTDRGLAATSAPQEVTNSLTHPGATTLRAEALTFVGSWVARATACTELWVLAVAAQCAETDQGGPIPRDARNVPLWASHSATYRDARSAYSMAD